MARRDGTGPMGQGPLTGRGMGYCGSEVVGRPYGRGGGYGRPSRCRRDAGFARGANRGPRAMGFGYRQDLRDYPMEADTMSEKEWLNEEKAVLKERLNLISQELDKIDNE